MIGALTGKVSHIFGGYIFLDVGGVGYEIQLHDRLLQKFRVGEEVSVIVHTDVREDRIQLFGFSSVKERDLFYRLIKVPGVGAKVAMGLLGALGAEGVVGSIAASDTKKLCLADGIGGKLASRLVSELRGNISDLAPVSSEAVVGDTKRNIILAALEKLGYERRQIDAILVRHEKDDKDKSVEETIAEILREMA